MSAGEPLRLAILLSGRGSNMAAIARACAANEIDAVVDVVVSDRADIAGLDIARSLGIATAVVPWKSLPSRETAEEVLRDLLEAHRPDLIVLAGFMRILSAKFVERHVGRILNIHPSLLPKYQGLNTHRRVLEAGDIQHGATVHFVTAELDGGPAVLQSRIAVRAKETEAEISARVQKTEHIIYPRVIAWFAEGRLRWREGSPWLDGRPLTAPLVEDFND